LAEGLPDADRDTLVAAAWLHDVGYVPDLAHTGFHPLDGARFLQAERFPTVIVDLVAYHSGALFEAHERGLVDELSDFVAPPDDLLRRLTAADMTTGPNGARVSARARIAEILTRYPSNDPVHRAVARSGPSLIEVVEQIDADSR
jgi:hypothetical protein